MLFRSAIESTQDILENFGGHTFAVGVTIKEENLETFKKRLETFADENMIEEQMTQTLDIDMALDLVEINNKLFQDIKRMNPFGPENQKPVFCSFRVKDGGGSKLVGRELEHIKLELVDDMAETVVHAIAFGQSRHFEYIKSGKPIDICYTIEENTYNNVFNLQLYVKDIKPSE